MLGGGAIEMSCFLGAPVENILLSTAGLVGHCVRACVCARARVPGRHACQAVVRTHMRDMSRQVPVQALTLTVMGRVILNLSV